MNTRRWITAALAGTVGLGLTGAISAGHLQRLPTLDRMPGAEIVDELTSWQCFAQLRLAIVSWIERTYHRPRRQARLGRLTPVEFEMVQPVQAAAPA